MLPDEEDDFQEGDDTTEDNGHEHGYYPEAELTPSGDGYTDQYGDSHPSEIVEAYLGIEPDEEENGKVH